MDIPDAASGQLTKASLKNFHVKLNLSIRIKAIFRNTCPKVANRHWMVAYVTNRSILITVLVCVIYSGNDYIKESV